MIDSIAGEKIRVGKARLVTIGLLAIFVASLLLLLVSASPARSAATFTVNSTGDGGDSSTADNICDSDAGTGGEQCTLRAAIQQANAGVASNEYIKFEIPASDPGYDPATGVWTISPTSGLPTITNGST